MVAYPPRRAAQPVLPGMPEPVPPAPRPPEPRKQRRPSKHDLDPRDKYIRLVKGGKWQLRPYCSILGVRYDLGLFDSKEDARRAREKFWAGGMLETPRFTRRIRTREGERYMAHVHVAGERFKLGPFLTRAEAAAAARGVLIAVAGPLFAECYIGLTGKSYHKVKPKGGKPSGQPAGARSA